MLVGRATRCGRIAHNPVGKVQKLRHDTILKERRSLELDEVQRLFEASPPHLLPVWRMFMCTAIRKSELVAMEFSDIDFSAKTVTVRAATAKNHKAREIPLDDTMLEMLRELQSQAPSRRPVTGPTEAQTAQQATLFSRDLVFTTECFTPLKNVLLFKFYGVCRKAGIEGRTRVGASTFTL